MAAPLEKLLLAPDAGAYRLTFGPATVGATLVGGRSRARLDQKGAPAILEVQWTTDDVGYGYLAGFFNQRLVSGSRPFKIDLIVGTAWPIENEAQFLPGSFSLSAVRGNLYTLAARLELKVPPRNNLTDNSLLAVYGPDIVDGMRVLSLTPSRTSYGAQRGMTLLSSKPGLGPSRVRLDRRNTPTLLNVGWNVGPKQFEYLLAFYFKGIAEGALPFVLDAVIDNPAVRQHRAMLVPGTFALEGIDGRTYAVTAQVEAVPIFDAVLDEAAIETYETGPVETPDITEEVALSLAHLVNVKMPATL